MFKTAGFNGFAVQSTLFTNYFRFDKKGGVQSIDIRSIGMCIIGKLWNYWSWKFVDLDTFYSWNKSHDLFSKY